MGTVSAPELAESFDCSTSGSGSLVEVEDVDVDVSGVEESTRV